MTPALGERSLHVWRIDVRRPRSELEDLRVSLSPAEEERARRFRFERDRDSFACTRAALRALLASYLGLAPQGVELTYTAAGKPEVAGISFNVSHSGDQAVAAFARSARVGVDVEEMRTEPDLRGLARRVFTRRESDVLEALDGDELVVAFYRCWTRKEAFVKAVGEGLSFDLERIEVSTGPAPAIVAVDGEPADGWWIGDVSSREGYAAAVVADLPGAELTVLDWRGAGVAAL